MNRNLIILVILLFCNKTLLRSQNIGLGYGININYMETHISGLSHSDVIAKNGINYHAKYIDKFIFFSWELGLGTIEKNYSVDRTGRFSGIFHSYKNTYLQIPLKIHYNFLQKIKFDISLNMGTFFSYWMFSKQSGVIPNVFNTSNIISENGEISQSFKYEKYETRYKFNSRKDNRYELGICSGIQMNYNLTEKYYLFFGFNYYRSLTDQQKEYMFNQSKKINSTFSFEGGLMFHIHQRKDRL